MSKGLHAAPSSPIPDVGSDISPEQLRGYRERALALKTTIEPLLVEGQIPSLQDGMHVERREREFGIEIVAMSRHNDHPFTLIFKPDGGVLFIQDNGGFQRAEISADASSVTPSYEKGRNMESREVIEQVLAAFDDLVNYAHEHGWNPATERLRRQREKLEAQLSEIQGRRAELQRSLMGLAAEETSLRGQLDEMPDPIGHDAIVPLINAVLPELGIAPDSAAASVARDYGSSMAPMVFWQGTADALKQAHKEGLSTVSSDPRAIVMTMRHNDPLSGVNGQIDTCRQARGILQAVLDRESLEPLTDGHVRARIRAFDTLVQEMEQTASRGDTPPKIDEREKRDWFVNSVIRRIEQMRARGILFEGFSRGTESGATYDNPAVIKLRTGDELLGETAKATRQEIEIKYDVDLEHTDFPNLEALEREGRYEDHEQAYVFAREAADDLPSYELRCRKIVKATGETLFQATIKAGSGTSRKEIEFAISEALYQAFLSNRIPGSRAIAKRRYFVQQTDAFTTTIDKAEIDGVTDYSSETEFSEAIPADYQAPAWTAGERGSQWKMRHLALNGLPPREA